MADPFAPPIAANPFQGQQQPDTYGAQAQANPFAAQPTPQQQQQPFGYPQQQQQPPSFQQPMPPAQQPQSYDPFSQAPPQQQPPPAGQYNNALVPSQQPGNPYAGLVAPAPAAPPAAPGSYDPFAAPPPAASSQALVPVAPNEGTPYPGAPAPYQQQQQLQYQQPPPQQQYQQPPAPQQQPPAPAPSPPAGPPVSEVGIVPAPSSGYPGAPRPPPSTPRPSSTPTDKETATPTGAEARNKYSGSLAQNAPLGASPLPRADMVKKTGYVLSRISFRTIVMKKWKQSFWVQYGPHTMLWFRSQADFDDWLNNPYHSQAQRNFLIKLAVNFAHDLYKPNVRGYQVTQCRTKSYGTKLIRQFKLERWMDYGPTIAAAFGSNNPKEVDDLREALVACMRNTPLNGGIRATGAVRQGGSNDQQGYTPQGEIPSSPADGYGNRSAGSASDMRADQRGFDDTASLGEAAEPAAPPDLLDFSEPVETQPANLSHQTSFHSQPAYATQSAPMQQNQYPGTPQSQPPQYGAPPPPQQQFQGAPPGHYPVQQQQQQQPFGAPPPMQQQYPPQGQPQAFGGY